MEQSLAEWLSMGGHGRYVWPAYGLTLLLLAGLALASWRARRAIKAALDKTP